MKAEKKNIINKHSSRIRTARLPTVSHCPSWRGGGVLRSQGRLRSGVIVPGGYGPGVQSAAMVSGVYGRGVGSGEYSPREVRS